jgi:hypothetical protein
MHVKGANSTAKFMADSLVLQRFSRVERVTGIEPVSMLSENEPFVAD